MNMTTENTSENQTSLLRLRDVEARVGFKKTTIYRLMKKKQFPRSIHPVGSKISAWVSAEIDDWIKEQIGNHREQRL